MIGEFIKWYLGIGIVLIAILWHVDGPTDVSRNRIRSIMRRDTQLVRDIVAVFAVLVLTATWPLIVIGYGRRFMRAIRGR